MPLSCVSGVACTDSPVDYRLWRQGNLCRTEEAIAPAGTCNRVYAMRQTDQQSAATRQCKEITMSESTRRDFIQGTAALSVLSAAALPLAAAAESTRMNSAFDYQHSPVALPFDAKALKGISEKLIQSHWENNYSGAVKALNTVRGKLTQAMSEANTPPYLYSGLKREQLFRT